MTVHNIKKFRSTIYNWIKGSLDFLRIILGLIHLKLFRAHLHDLYCRHRLVKRHDITCYVRAPREISFNIVENFYTYITRVCFALAEISSHTFLESPTKRVSSLLPLSIGRYVRLVKMISKQVKFVTDNRFWKYLHERETILILSDKGIFKTWDNFWTNLMSEALVKS